MPEKTNKQTNKKTSNLGEPGFVWEKEQSGCKSKDIKIRPLKRSFLCQI